LIWLNSRAILCLQGEGGVGVGGSEGRQRAALTPWQSRLFAVNGALYRCLLFAFGFLCVDVRGRPGWAEGPGRFVSAPTIVSNHVTLADALLLGAAMRGRLTCVAVSWVGGIPCIASIARAHGVLLVKSAREEAPKTARVRPQPEATVEGPPASQASRISAYQIERAANPSLLPLLIFPEGTTKAERCLAKFRTGAFLSGQPVQPVVLRFPHTHDDLSWCGTEGIGANFRRMLTTWRNHAVVEWMEPYVPTERERADPHAYAQGVQRAMAEHMALPPQLSSTTIDNKRLADYIFSSSRPGDADARTTGAMTAPAWQTSDPQPGSSRVTLS